jgi:hypothetical protein
MLARPPLDTNKIAVDNVVANVIAGRAFAIRMINQLVGKDGTIEFRSTGTENATWTRPLAQGFIHRWFEGMPDC